MKPEVERLLRLVAVVLSNVQSVCCHGSQVAGILSCFGWALLLQISRQILRKVFAGFLSDRGIFHESNFLKIC